MNSLIPLRAYTAHLFAKATKDLFPQALLLGGEVDEIGFTYNFEVPQTINADMLPLFEEKMRGWVKSPPTCRVQEMVPPNAGALFKDRGEVYLKDFCNDSDEELVPVIMIDGFFDVVFSDSLLDEELPFEKFAFKLIKLTVEGKKVSVFGTAFPDSSELKDFVKKYKEASKRDGIKIARTSRLMIENEEGNFFLLPKGVDLEDQFKKWFVNMLPEKVKQVRTPISWTRSLNESHTFMFEADHALSGNSLWEWRGDSDFLSQFALEEEADLFLKSSLQLIEKTSKMFGFEYHGTLCGLSPPKFENNKRLKDNWKAGVARFKQLIKEEGLPLQLDESVSTKLGPEYQIRYYDALGRSFEGPKLSIDCVTLEALKLVDHPCFQGRILVARELFPDLTHLMLKLVEEGSIYTILRELGR